MMMIRMAGRGYGGEEEVVTTARNMLEVMGMV